MLTSKCKLYEHRACKGIGRLEMSPSNTFACSCHCHGNAPRPAREPRPRLPVSPKRQR